MRRLLRRTWIHGELMLGLLVFAIAPALASDKASCWLEETDVIIPAAQSRTFMFQTPNPVNELKPVLWMAPRTVFVMEERLVPTLVIELNGVKLDAPRLISPNRTARFPCDLNCPVRESEKCVLC